MDLQNESILSSSLMIEFMLIAVRILVIYCTCIDCSNGIKSIMLRRVVGPNISKMSDKQAPRIELLAVFLEKAKNSLD